MPVARGPTPRFIFILLGAVLTGIFFLSSFHKSTATTHQATGSIPAKNADLSIDPSLLSGHAIAPKLGNETAKAEIGRAAWKYFHTVMARFPDEPTADESSALKSYIHLFQRLYPCGECAEHFGQLLKEFPPQTSSRSAAAVWACHVHNQVNKSLNKEMFDCANIGDFYDCGCAEDEKDGKAKKKETRGLDILDIPLEAE